MPKCNYVLFGYSKNIYWRKIDFMLPGISVSLQGYGFQERAAIWYGRKVLLFRKNLLFACLFLLYTEDRRVLYNICASLHHITLHQIPGNRIFHFLLSLCHLPARWRLWWVLHTRVSKRMVEVVFVNWQMWGQCTATSTANIRSNTSMPNMMLPLPPWRPGRRTLSSVSPNTGVSLLFFCIPPKIQTKWNLFKVRLASITYSKDICWIFDLSKGYMIYSLMASRLRS